MATAARLTAAISVAVAIALVLLSGYGGFIGLIWWLSVGLLALGLVVGHRGGVAAMAVGYMIGLGLQLALAPQVSAPLWARALLLTLALETASMSFTFRIRPADPLVMLVRGTGTALIVSGLVVAMGIAVAGSGARGILVSAAGTAALVIAASWVIRTWKKSGLV